MYFFSLRYRGGGMIDDWGSLQVLGPGEHSAPHRSKESLFGFDQPILPGLLLSFPTQFSAFAFREFFFRILIPTLLSRPGISRPRVLGIFRWRMCFEYGPITTNP